MSETTIQPFSNGTQYGDWTDNNCRSCKKAADPDNPTARCPCDIEQALLEAYCGDGRIPLPIAERMGQHEGRYSWACKEHDPPWKERPKESVRLSP